MSSGALVVTALREQDAPAAAQMARQTAQPAEQSVAVLPFANMSANVDDGYFADGITEEIINLLAQLKGLHVAARTSCFAFKGKDEDLRVVGEKLGVKHILEGSVRKAGSHVRITAQLINAADGYHIWSERYDHDLVDIFALQDDIANSIAKKLQLSLLDAPNRDVTRTGLRNVEAYELLLKGRVLLRQRGPATLDALACFQRAVALDPELVEAHALLADAYRLIWIYGMAPASETIPQARAAIACALALDSDDPQALSTLSNIASSYDLDVERCLALADRVLAREPLRVETLCERGFVVALRRDSSPESLAKAIHHIRTARGADPLNAWAAAIESMSLACIGNYEDAVREAQHAVALDPLAFTGRWALVWTLAVIGKDDEAITAATEALLMSGRHPRILADVAAIHARRGETRAALEILEELRGRAAAGFVEHSVLGAVAASSGLMAEARALVARGIAEHEVFWQFAKSPAWAPFRADSEGAAMLHALGF